MFTIISEVVTNRRKKRHGETYTCLACKGCLVWLTGAAHQCDSRMHIITIVPGQVRFGGNNAMAMISLIKSNNQDSTIG